MKVRFKEVNFSKIKMCYVVVESSFTWVWKYFLRDSSSVSLFQITYSFWKLQFHIPSDFWKRKSSFSFLFFLKLFFADLQYLTFIFIFSCDETDDNHGASIVRSLVLAKWSLVYYYRAIDIIVPQENPLCCSTWDCRDYIEWTHWFPSSLRQPKLAKFNLISVKPTLGH